MTDFERIHFAYFPLEAELPVVAWCLKMLDLKLVETDAKLMISDIKFGRGGLEISWDLTGDYSEGLESEIEQEMEWICRRVATAI